MKHAIFFALQILFVVSSCQSKQQSANLQSVADRTITTVKDSLSDPNPMVSLSSEWAIDQSSPFSVVLTNQKIEGSLIIQMIEMAEGGENLGRVTDEIVELISEKLKATSPPIEKVDFQNQPANQFVIEHKAKKYYHLVFIRRNTPFMISLQSPVENYSEAFETAIPVFNSLRLFE